MTLRPAPVRSEAPGAPAGGDHGQPDRADAGAFGVAMLLACLAGWVDAAGFSGSARIFVSFMSGNTTQGSLALAHGDWSRMLDIALVIALFVAGVVVGELLGPLARRFAPSAVLIVEAGLLGIAAWLAQSPSQWLVTDLLAAAMGLQNATMHRADGINVSLTYITGTLVQLGRSLATMLRGGNGAAHAARFAALWFCLACGACGSGFMLLRSRQLVLAIAAGVAVLLAGWLLITPRTRIAAATNR